MRIMLALLLLLIAACSPDIIYVMSEPEPEPIIEEPTAPVWIPEPWHIYVLDATDAILIDELAQPADVYWLRFSCWSLTVELWNRDNPDALQHVVGGGIL